MVMWVSLVVLVLVLIAWGVTMTVMWSKADVAPNTSFREVVGNPEPPEPIVKTRACVVAHYKEDISWIQNLGVPYESIYLYEKGGQLVSWNGARVFQLANIGRESHTYLTYIVQNYPNFPDLVTFTQGCISDHTSMEALSNYECSSKESMAGNWEFRITEWRGTLKPNKDDLAFGEWAKKYLNPSLDMDTRVCFHYGACFTTTRERLLSHSLQTYQTLLEMVSDSDGGEVGHFLERSWGILFH